MSIATLESMHLVGLQAETVSVEVDISNGLHSFSVVGLGDRAVEEAKDRIAAAIKNSGYTSPKQKNQKVVISLAPAYVRKEGASFDLAMALAYLVAAGELSFDIERKLFLGELSLDGAVRRVSGILPMICQAAERGFTQVFVPRDNALEASLARNIRVFTVSSLREAIDHLSGTIRLSEITPRQSVPADERRDVTDMSVIRGNESAKRGLEIAAAGAHNVIMYGPPGTGKTMLARSFSSILPPLTYEQSVEVTGIHSAAQNLPQELVSWPPFRAPHHTASYPSIVGGGSVPRPGEVTLAHRGVLFLDEFPEFDRSVIEALRQPLEDRVVTISRARGTVTFPAQCIVVASMNPCPCGKGQDGGCSCSPRAVASYARRISGPIMDRLDISLNVSAVDYEKLSLRSAAAESSATIRARIERARDIQKKRFASFGVSKNYNSEMGAQDIERMVVMNGEARSLLTLSARRFRLSGRAFHRVIKVAQTIADLAGVSEIKKEAILEALQYRHHDAA